MQGRDQGELEPVTVLCADLLAADRERLPVQAHGLLERQLLGRHVGGRRARRHRQRPVTGPRRLDPVPGDLRQVQPQLPLVQSFDRVRRGAVQPPLLRGAQPGGHRRADQRVREPVIAGTVAGHQEPGRPALFQRAEQGQHGYVQHPGHHSDREVVACYRGGLQQRLGGPRQLAEPVGRRVHHPSRHRRRPAATLLDEHPGQFPYQERVASRLGMHLVGLIIRRGQPGGEEHVADRVGGKATQVHPLGVGLGRQAGQEPAPVPAAVPEPR